MVFKRNYIIRKGSTFHQIITLSDIYVALDSAETYTIEGAIMYVADNEKKYSITGVLTESNTILTLTMASADTDQIVNIGKYDYAIDIMLSGVVQTVLEGNILVKENVSKII